MAPNPQIRIDQKVKTLIESQKEPGETPGDYLYRIFTFDDQESYEFFSHLRGRAKGDRAKEEYLTELADLELTQQELIDMAMKESGRSFESLMREGMLQVCKDAITRSARNQYRKKIGEESPEERLAGAMQKLKNKLETGWIPRARKITISTVCSYTEPKVNLNTAKSWVISELPDTLHDLNDKGVSMEDFYNYA